MLPFPSACIWSAAPRIAEILNRVKQTAFHYIDIEPDSLDDPAALQAQKELGLKVSCVALDHRLPDKCSLDARDDGSLRQTLDHLKGGIGKARDLGALTAYVASCAEAKNLVRYGTAVRELADCAQKASIRLCIEHVPGRALATAAETVRFIERTGHSNLYLLLDVGHTLLSGENAWEIVRAAGDRVGSVQLNDNDGKKDLHWPLLDGRLTRESLVKTLGALTGVGYSGTLGLEIAASVNSLVSAWSKNRNLVIRLLQGIEAAG